MPPDGGGVELELPVVSDAHEVSASEAGAGLTVVVCVGVVVGSGVVDVVVGSVEVVASVEVLVVVPGSEAAAGGVVVVVVSGLVVESLVSVQVVVAGGMTAGVVVTVWPGSTVATV